MSPDEHDPTIDDPVTGLSAADEARIRRLLADAKHTDPMPEDVVARLDRVLAGLAEEQLAPVVELASRRRRTAAKLLVAAAAVVVAGVGIAQVLPGNGVGGGGGSADTAMSTQEDAAGGSAAKAPQLSDPASGRTEAPSPESGPADLAVVRVRSAHFGPDVRRARVQAARELPDGTEGFLEYAPGCDSAPDLGRGTVLPATYDDAPAYLVLRPPAGDTQVVDLYLCGDTDPRRTITLTTP